MIRRFFLLLVVCFSILKHSGDAAPYIGLLGGATGGFDLKDSHLDTSWGYYVGGKVGVTCGSLIRLEEELCYQSSKVDSFSRKGFEFHHVRGDVRFWSLMTNLLVDLDCPFIVSPYFGGGIGYAREEGKGSATVSLNKERHVHEKVNKNAFAWQGILGFKWLVCLDLEASFEYRYFKAESVDPNHKFGLAVTKLF